MKKCDNCEKDGELKIAISIVIPDSDYMRMTMNYRCDECSQTLGRRVKSENALITSIFRFESKTNMYVRDHSTESLFPTHV
jgi:hypothetical protein